MRGEGEGAKEGGRSCCRGGLLGSGGVCETLTTAVLLEAPLSPLPAFPVTLRVPTGPFLLGFVEAALALATPVAEDEGEDEGAGLCFLAALPTVEARCSLCLLRSIRL